MATVSKKDVERLSGLYADRLTRNVSYRVEDMAELTTSDVWREASEALNLAMTYAHDERPDVLRILSAVSSGIEEVSWAVIEARAFK